MKIVINALSARLGGGQTYILNFLRYLTGENEILLLVGPYNRDKFANAIEGKDFIKMIDCGARQERPLYRLFWERFTLSRLLKRWGADVYYAAGGGTLVKTPKKCVNALAIRNMLPFDDRERARFPLFSKGRLKLRLLRSIAIHALKRSDKVIFISRYSFNSILRRVPSISGKSTIIPHGLDAAFRKPPEKEFDFSRFGLKKGEFYLYLSVFNYYKAQLELVEEWKRLTDAGFPYPLVLTGFMTPGYSQKVLDLIRDLNLEEKVIVTGPVDYADLPAYFAGARALVFASSCECCPNILLEMMTAGKPIFSSRIPPMPEFGGPEPYYFDPYRPGELAELVREAEEDPSEMTRRGEAIREFSRRYDWEKTVKETIRFLTDS